MPTPLLTSSTRYTSQGVTKVYYLPTVAASNLTPTRTEMNAGTDLSNEIADWDGWMVTSEKIDTPNLGTTFTEQIPGRTSVEDSSITFYASKNGVDARSLLPRLTTGYMMFCDGGDIPGNKADVFPIQVMSVGKVRSVGGDAADQLTIQFSTTLVPGENVTIPA